MTNQHCFRITMGVGLLLFTSVACTGSVYTSEPGSFEGGSSGVGATPGGAQDIGFARTLIGDGHVPSADTITTEGLFSEHDFPGEENEAPCEELFCLRPVLGIAQDLRTHRYEHFVLMGMTSGLRDFRRPPLDVVAVVDRSGAMSIDMAETNEALASMVDHLGPQDRLAVVIFNQNVEELVALGPVDDRDAIKRRIAGIQPNGGSNVDAAMARGFEVARSAGANPGRLRRVMLFTCGFPPVERGFQDGFSRAVRDAAGQGIGTSVFGVLLGYSALLWDLMGVTPGGSAYYLESLERVRTVFAQDFDFMVTPIAYNMHLGFAVGGSYDLDRFYGVPAQQDGTQGNAVDVATVFLSRERGGLLARLRRKEDAADFQAGRIRLSYTPESSLGVPAGDPQSFDVAFPPSLPDSGPAFYQSRGVRVAVALSNQAELMRDAIGLYRAQPPRTADAQAMLAELAAHLRSEAAAIPDASLVPEAELVERLSQNMAH